MKSSFKRHWKAVLAFAVGGAMCLGMGVFVLANQSAQTQLDNSSQVQDDQPQLLLQSADGLNNNGGNANNGIITVSEWSETGVYGTSGSSSSSTTSNIWQSINNKAIGGVAGVCTVTLSLTTNDGTYSIPIKVANGASCSASANVLTIAGVNFTAPSIASYKWKIDGSTTIPSTIIANCTATYECIPGLYTDNTYSTLATLSNSKQATWANIMELYPSAFADNGATIQGTSSSLYSYLTDLSDVLVISSSVTSIGNYAFRSCKSLTSIIIGSGVESIGDYAFENCTGLTSITIPNSVTSIGGSAFDYCKGLTSITIPSSVTSIGNSTFDDCSGLASITVESGNTVYDSRNNCNAIIQISSNTLIAGCKNTIIPNDVTSIGSWAFRYHTGLTSITIPNSVTSIGNGAFCGCSGLTSITIPDGVTSIGNQAFCACSGLTSITIPNSVTSIGYMVFYSCIGLTSITIPSRVTSIGDYEFNRCSGLTSITIPNSVTSIGFQAFQYCSGLTSIEFDGTVAEWNAITKGDSWNVNVPATTVVSCTDGLAIQSGTALNITVSGNVATTYYSYASGTTTYTLKFKANEGYTLPESVSATLGGNAIDSSNITWTVADGVGTITIVSATAPTAEAQLAITVTAVSS